MKVETGSFGEAKQVLLMVSEEERISSLRRCIRCRSGSISSSCDGRSGGGRRSVASSWSSDVFRRSFGSLGRAIGGAIHDREPGSSSGWYRSK